MCVSLRDTRDKARHLCIRVSIHPSSLFRQDTTGLLIFKTQHLRALKIPDRMLKKFRFLKTKSRVALKVDKLIKIINSS